MNAFSAFSLPDAGWRVAVLSLYRLEAGLRNGRERLFVFPATASKNGAFKKLF